MTEKIRVLIADDEVLLRDGLRTIIDLEEDMEVAGMAADGREAYELAQELRPDVVLLDIRMPGMDGVESLRLIKRALPRTKVVMLTTFNDEEYIVGALAAEADGYLLKDLEGQQLVDAVRRAAQDQLMLPAKVAGKLAERLAMLQAIEDIKRGTRARGTDMTTDLTPREREIAALMVQGLTNREIADHLSLSEGTVKNYISVIYSKLGTSNRTQAIAYLAKYLK
ncbi:MAG TPA: response regulator transcription factor [Firmicutes bacterium]|nr:response regulator transcription factor [Bacillota bacterium]